MLLAWGPAFLPYGFHRLYAPWAEASPNMPMRIDVLPGDIEILKGSDQKIEALLVGFDAPNVHLQMQPEGGDVWNPIRMEPKTGGGDFHYLLIDIQSPMRYFVEARGVRSESYSIRVVDLAKVEQIDLTYNFPKYTGMSPKHVENTGDITALKGTEVGLAIRFDQPVRSVAIEGCVGHALERQRLRPLAAREPVAVFEHDSPQPSRERVRCPQIGQPAVGVDEGLLRHVLSEVEVAEDRVGVSVGHVLELADDPAEGLEVTRARPFNE